MTISILKLSGMAMHIACVTCELLFFHNSSCLTLLHLIYNILWNYAWHQLVYLMIASNNICCDAANGYFICWDINQWHVPSYYLAKSEDNYYIYEQLLTGLSFIIPIILHNVMYSLSLISISLFFGRIFIALNFTWFFNNDYVCCLNFLKID